MPTPTIGIEIELPWRTMLERVDTEAAYLLAESDGFYSLDTVKKNRVQRGFDAVDAIYKDRVNAVFNDDIHQKSDGYTEFAFAPKQNYQQISQTVNELYNTEILMPGEKYPLHITLGGLTIRNNSWLILVAAELSGGATPERMTEINTWSQKGHAGIRQRGARELALGATTAIEMRTLQTSSFEQLDSTLKISQLAGAVLLSKLEADSRSEKMWRELLNYLIDAADIKGIDIRSKWKNPQNDPRPWQQLGVAMGDSKWVGQIHTDVLSILQG